ncbi:MAG: MFS transporter [Actinomycetales bacterium]|nr:MFS transporter [Actinomycetales bacterium]
MSTPPTTFRWRSVVVAAFLPTFLFSTAQGAMLPVIPTVADDLGASLALAGLIAATLLIGEVLGDIPSGLVVGRIGERWAMIGAAVIAIGGGVIALLARDPLTLGVAVFVIGVAASTFALARHAFLTSYVPLHQRARALSTLGGVHRLGLFVGPVVMSVVIQLTGAPVLGFAVLIGGAALAILALLVLRDPEATFGRPGSRAVAARTGEIEVRREAQGVFRTWRRHARVLASVGLGAALFSALRASRQVILPLWALSIGLPDSLAALVIGLGGLVDFTLFYTGGWIMDRFGRLWVAVPALAGLGLWHIVLGLTHDLPGAAGWFVAITGLLALTNGISSGILMTLGADLADRRDPAPFLGAWRFTADVGSAAIPLVIAAITALASLPAAAVVVGVLGLAGSGILRLSLPRHVPATVLVRRGEPAPAAAAAEPGGGGPTP